MEFNTDGTFDTILILLKADRDCLLSDKNARQSGIQFFLTELDGGILGAYQSFVKMIVCEMKN